MGLRMRKSITIAKGVRLNFSKSGMGVSFGTRGLRYSINSSGRRTSTIGIPGTGIYYTTSTGGKKSYSSGAYKRRQELQNQRQQQRLNEIQKNTLSVEEYNNFIDLIKGIHRECDEYVNWRNINSLKPPFNPPEPGPNKIKALSEYENFSPTFFERLFTSKGEKRKEEFKMAIEEAEQRDNEDYQEWKNLNELSSKILDGDIDAYFQVIDEMNPLDDLLQFGSDFEFGADNSRTMEVEFRVKSSTVVPDYTLSLTKTGKLSRKSMTKTQYYDLVKDYVCSCTIRIARDIFALLPLEKVVVHAVDNILDTSTGHMEDITILSVAFDRETLEKLNIDLIDPSEALKNFLCRMEFKKTQGFKAVERITNY